MTEPRLQPIVYSDHIDEDLVNCVRSWILKDYNWSIQTNLDGFEKSFNISLLLLASFLGLEDIVSTILINSIYDIDKGYEAAYNAGPLHVAIPGGHIKVVQELVKAGANINSTTYYLPPLIIATKWGNIEVTKFLIMRRADLNVSDSAGNTPLHYAAYIGSGSLVQLLLNNRGNPNAENQNESTPLDILLEALFKMSENMSDERLREYEKVVDILITKGADVNTKRSDGWTPLHGATFSVQINIVKTLLRAGADPNALGVDVSTPLTMSYFAWR